MAKKYIDVERLKVEIEKRLKNVRDYMNGAGMKYKGPKYYKAQGKESAYDALLNVIDSLQQKQPEVDLEKEYQEFCKDYPFPWSSQYVNREYIDELCLSVARHFYGLRNRILEEAARHVYESWMGGAMNDVRRDMVELGKVLNTRNEESK